MEHVYFIESGLVSVLAQIDERKAAEVWLIGREGLSGIPLLLGGSASPHRRVVQLGGSALRMRAADVHAAMNGVPSFRAVMLRYVQLALVQTSQTSACNSAHPIKQRLARWLLTAQDRIGRDVLPLTHDMLARLLSVRRATISECLALLEREQVVGTRRAQLEILDRGRLESMSCLCYRIMANEHERMMRDLRAPWGLVFDHGTGRAPVDGHGHTGHRHETHLHETHHHDGHRHDGHRQDGGPDGARNVSSADGCGPESSSFSPTGGRRSSPL
ncbi:CRP-like cAMP-binding protein [Rhodoplanes tepidamans]|nr:Crp/Fnr family transcriptional regulator [Rhodoplanes tepidamans]MDQ0356549.1 CRP-like cAMP-binding protein [Rhodoplanes tepidamans]